MANVLLRVDGHVPARGVEVGMAEQLGRDVDGQTAVYGLGGEQPSEVVGSET
jgi:hypothetical protein